MKIKITTFILIYLFKSTSLFSAEVAYEIFANSIKYEDNNQIIIAEGNAKANDKNGKKIFSDKITYNKKKNIIKTFKNTIFFDDSGNKITTDSLTYNINSKSIISNSKAEILDNKNNKYIFSNILYNTETKKGSGQKFNGQFNNKSSFISDNIAFDLNTKNFYLTKAKYTSCSKIYNKSKDYCPSWSLHTSKTNYDDSSKTISHKNMVLKVQKIPILYMPYLEHPDPSVKRRSGFLTPYFKSLSSIGKAFYTPYFMATNESEDLTITPAFFFNNKPLILAEYRKKFKNSYLKIDTSYIKDSHGEISKGSKNHFYLNYNIDHNNYILDTSKITIQIQKVSQENYLKTHQINTSLAKEDDKKLENKFQLIAFNDKSSLDLNAKIFEDLNKHSNDKYEYVFPYGSYSYVFNKFNQNINLDSKFISKKYGNNLKSSEVTNSFNTTSNPKIFDELGSSHIFKTKITNINKYSSENKSKSINNFFTVALDNSLPFYKKNKKTEEILSPKIFVKYTTGSMKTEKDTDKNFYFSDIYSMDRSPNITNPETGFSVGTGIDYELTKKRLNNEVFLKNIIGFGQIFRTTELDQMPSKTSLDKKSSDFAGFYNLSIIGEKKKFDNTEKINFLNYFDQNKINIKYDFNLENNFSRFTRNNIELNTTVFNKIYSTINFDEKNKYNGSERKVEYGINYLINNNFYFNSSVLKNLKDNLKEKELFGIQYENDCIKLGINLKKEFYSNTELSNNKSLFFSIILKPFNNEINPDLSAFVK